MKNFKLYCICFLLLACGGGSDDDETPTEANCPLVGIETGECPTGDFTTLVWEEEFDGNGIDATTWSFEMGDGCPDLCGWGNNEQQYYATSSNNSAASRKSAASAIISHDSIAISSFHWDKVTWSTGPSERHLDTNLPGVLGTSISDILLTLPWNFRYIGDK